MESEFYLQARREWDERYGDLVLGKRNWQIRSAGLMLLCLILAFGIVYTGAVTITLPPATSGARFSVIKTDSSANACTVATTGSDTFVGGGTTSGLASQGAVHSYAADGTALYGVF